MQLAIVTHPTFRAESDVDEAITIVNSQQDWFELLRQSADWVKDEDQTKGSITSTSVFANKRAAVGEKPTIIVTRRPIKGGYFADGDANTVLISTAAWEKEYPARPTYLYLSSMIAGQLAFLCTTIPSDIEDLQSERHEGETTGCVNDYCEVITDIWENMLHTHICAACEAEFLRFGLAPKAATSLDKLLMYLRNLNTSYGKNIQPDVFISYNSVDEEIATKLSFDIQKRGFKTWIGRFDLLPGDSLFYKIGEGLASSQVFIIVLSPRSVASGWCQRELANAIALEGERRSVFVIPALYEDCAIPTLIKDKVYADMRGDKYTESISRIVERVKENRSPDHGFSQP